MIPKVDFSKVTINTPRLEIRHWQKDDLADLYEYAKVPGVGEMAGWPHHESLEVSKEILNMFMANEREFALVNKENGRVIGSMGLKNSWVEEDENYSHLTAVELGYVLSKEYWGRGLMTEAVKATLDFCFEDLHLDAVTVCHFSHNDRSKRVIEKCGFNFVSREEFFAKLLGETFTDLKYIKLRP